MNFINSYLKEYLTKRSFIVLKSFQDQLQVDTIKKWGFPFKKIDVILTTSKIKLIRPVNKSF